MRKKYFSKNLHNNKEMEATMQSVAGTCGYTSSPGDCMSGNKGVLPVRRWSDFDDALQVCAQLCQRCQRCRFFSFSATWKDCSWFHECNGTVLTTPGFRSYHRKSNVTQASLPPSRHGEMFAGLRMAICASGQARGLVSSSRLSHGITHLLDAFNGTASLFSSIHHDGPVPDSLIQFVRGLSAAFEVYAFQQTAKWICDRLMTRCPQFRSDGESNWRATQICLCFYPQFDGIRRAYRMMLAHEERSFERFLHAARIRWDAPCTPLPMRRLALRMHRMGAHTHAFACAMRDDAQQNWGVYDCSDAGWLATRSVSDALFNSVEEYASCSPLLGVSEREGAPR